jgi:hypothetical protein
MIERLIAWLSPGWALRRLRARQALAAHAEQRPTVTMPILRGRPRVGSVSQWAAAPAVTDDRQVRRDDVEPWIPRREPERADGWTPWGPQDQRSAAMSGYAAHRADAAMMERAARRFGNSDPFRNRR